jgi:hypothetical protein
MMHAVHLKHRRIPRCHSDQDTDREYVSLKQVFLPDKRYLWKNWFPEQLLKKLDTIAV